MLILTDIDHLLCQPATSIRDALARIDQATPNLFQVVVDSEQRVVGTVTDGDVRRAMIRGVTLDDSVERCMNLSPKLVRAGDEADHRSSLRLTHFLPALDTDDQLVEIIVQYPADDVVPRALVMAGGFGRRLGDKTQDLPKPLLHVGGRTILARVLEQLEDAGVRDIHIAVHFLADKIERYIDTRDNRSRMQIICEDEPMGTAGALALLLAPLGEEVLLVNGDVVTKVDYNALRDYHLIHGHDVTVGVSRYDMRIPYGVIRRDEKGLFAGIDEKPTLSHFVAAGIYYLTPQFVSLVPRDRPVDMPEMLDNAHRAGLRIGVFPVHEYWIDIGLPDDLAVAESDYADETSPDRGPTLVQR